MLVNSKWNYYQVDGNWQNNTFKDQLILLKKFYPIGHCFDCFDTYNTSWFNIKVLIEGYTLHYSYHDKYYGVVIKVISGKVDETLCYIDGDVVSIHPGYLAPNLEYNREVKLNKIFNDK